MIFRWLMAGIFLMGGTFWDIREKKIPVAWMISGLLAACGCMIYECVSHTVAIRECLWACLPGTLFLLIFAVSHEQMGSGDGLALLVLGGLLGAKRVWLIWLLSLGGVFLFGVMLLIRKKGNGKTKIAFFPFLLLGYLIVAGGVG